VTSRRKIATTGDGRMTIEAPAVERKRASGFPHGSKPDPDAPAKAGGRGPWAKGPRKLHWGRLRLLGQQGNVMVEFALVAPLLMTIVLGTIWFAFNLNYYLTLTNAVSVGAMQFAASRWDQQPVTDALTAITNAAPTLAPADLTVTLSVGNPPPGTACYTGSAAAYPSSGSANTTCQTALTNAAPSGSTLTPASVTVTCTGTCLSFPQLLSFLPSFALTSTMAESVQ
jgi:Flp pilus assembly protein TadG